MVLNLDLEKQMMFFYIWVQKKIIHNNKYLYIFIFKKSNKIMFKIKQKLLSLFRERKKQYHHEILFLKLNYNNFVQEKFYLNICLGCFICLQLKN